MGGDTAGLRELSVADATVEWLLPGVGAAVRSEVGRLRKGLVAAVAPVRTLATVRAHVSLQGAGTGIAAMFNNINHC